MPRPHAGVNNPRGLTDIPLRIEPASAKDKARARRLADALAQAYPDAHCELEYTNAHELLIATILSAQATDVGVNKATPTLFAAFPTPADYAASTPEQIEPYIKTIGLFRNKSKSVHASMTSVIEDFGSEVPGTMAELLTLRGVARKTANVVLGNAFGLNNGFVVDTHIQRLSWRFGLTDEPKASPEKVERRLMALFPRGRWCQLSHQFIFHGRRACPARANPPHEHAICKRFGINCP
ncbi:MAG: endonuclease-3 [Phycisphaerales bacterium]|jgi:endonuclease-3